MRKRQHRAFRREIIIRGVVYGTLAILIFAAAASSVERPRSVPLSAVGFIEGDPVTVSGVGLVVGLDRTGDGLILNHTDRSLAGTMSHLGIDIQEQEVSVGRVAAVWVQGVLEPGFDPQAAIAVRVVALNDATDLSAGVLMPTILRSRDGRLVGTASGAISAVVNTPLGWTPASGQIDRALRMSSPVFMTAIPDRRFILGFHGLDAPTLSAIADLINSRFGVIANAHSGCDIEITLPPAYEDFAERAALVLSLADLPVETVLPIIVADRTAETAEAKSQGQ